MGHTSVGWLMSADMALGCPWDQVFTMCLSSSMDQQIPEAYPVSGEMQDHR